MGHRTRVMQDPVCEFPDNGKRFLPIEVERIRLIYRQNAALCSILKVSYQIAPASAGTLPEPATGRSPVTTESLLQHRRETETPNLEDYARLLEAAKAALSYLDNLDTH